MRWRGTNMHFAAYRRGIAAAPTRLDSTHVHDVADATRVERITVIFHKHVHVVQLSCATSKQFAGTHCITDTTHG